jgi:iron(III) transport system substrate-binding protein
VKSRVLLLTALALMALAAASCGDAVTSRSSASGATDERTKAQDVYAKLNGTAPDQQRAEALKMAKDEGGQLALYTGWSPLLLDQLIAAFEKDTGVKVTEWRGSGDDLRERVLQEASAGRLGADAVLGGTSSLFDIADAKLFDAYTGAQRENVVESGRFDTWTAASYTLIVPAWNTKLIKPGQEPKSWEDLASPRFEGKMAIDVSDWYWYGAVSEYWLQQGKSQAQVDELWKKIGAGSHVVNGHTATQTRMAAGNLALYADAYTPSIDLLRTEKGAPVSYRLKDKSVPVKAFAKSDGIGLTTAAKHPAAAWLFADWLLKEGQKVIEDSGKPTAMADSASGDKLNGIELLPASEQTIWDQRQKWQKAYDELLRGVG